MSVRDINGSTGAMFGTAMEPAGGSEMSIFVAGATIALALCWLFLPARPKSPYEVQAESIAERMRAAALVADFPIDEGLSVRRCELQGVFSDTCKRSENALRSEAAELWRKADKHDRLRCLGRSADAPGPAGYIYACLSSTQAKVP